jgi:hypothetical protein
MSEIPADGAAKVQRDLRLDVFRGLALVMIFINHVPGTVYEDFTNRNFGLSDAAEGFVLMSGVAAGLAYSPLFRAPPWWPGTGRVWARVWTLYLVHLFMTAWALAIAAGAALWLGTSHGLQVNEVQVFLREPLGFLAGVPLLTHQLGYVNILPMYAVMLFAAPVMLWLALRRPLMLAGLSVTLWFLTGLFAWNMPAFPNPGGWFFNPLAWQVIFVTGLLTGVAMRQGRRLVPVRAWAQWLAGAVLLGGLLWVRVPAVGDTLNHLMWLANQTGVNRFFTITDKTYVTWPRLVHLLALAYLLSSWDWVRRACGSAGAAPLALLGRNALPVFAAGSLLALTCQAIRQGAPPGLALDTALILGGLSLQLVLALVRDRLALKMW